MYLYADAPVLPSADRIELRELLVSRLAQIEIEIGPGRGGFMLERLAARADVGIVGLEIKRKWAKIVDDRLARAGFAGRGRVFAEDVRFALPRLSPDGSVAAVFLNFPDPWWKKRHAKRLVVRPEVLAEIARLLQPGGELFIQTDVEDRMLDYEAALEAHAAFEPRGDAPGSARLRDNPYQATSHRERRAVTDAIPIYRLRFARRVGAPSISVTEIRDS
jgi:tRNA (guanine-N7-)-methyltransferase